MGFLSAFANFGSIGSTSKWAIKMYNDIKSQNKNLKPNEIFFKMVQIRYESSPLGSNDYGMDFTTHMLNYSKVAPGLAGLIIEILNTEAELYKNEPNFLGDMIKPIFDKLEDTDLSDKEKYGHIKNNLRWTTHIYSFLDRVDR
tara:strand:- start:110 stop:538 length:429 start_codon:yes stop_codon:yes gene_type:complete